MPFPPPAAALGVPAARPPPRRPCAPPAPSPPAAAAAAAADPKRRPLERSEALLSSSWPSATPKRPPARRGLGLGPGTPQPPGPARAPPQAAPVRAGTPATCAAPRRAGCGHSRAGATAAGSGSGPDDAVRFSLSLTPEAVLLIQRRHLEKQLLARPRRPAFPAPPADPRRPQAPGARARPAGLRRGGAASAPDAPPAPGLPRRPPRSPLLLPGGLQAPVPGPRPADLRPVLKVSLLNDRHKYDDVEYEEEPDVVDEGLVRKCTEWLRGVESASATRDRTRHLDSLPHLSTL